MAAKGLKKIKSTNKNTAPKGVKARMINPQLDQPTTPFWNPSDLPSGNEIADWLNQQRSQWNYYGGYQGPPTPMPGPSDMPAANIGAYPFSYNPTAPTTPASPTTPTLPGVGVVPSYPMYGPPVPGAQTYAPVNTGAGGIPPQAPLPEGYEYPYWAEESAGRPAYEWKEVDGQIKLLPNDRAFPGAPVPELDVNGNPWSSVYSKDFYSTQDRNPLQWLAGSSNGGNMGSRGWRRPGRYYIPDQQVTRAGPNGPITAERPPKPPRRGETPTDSATNVGNAIPAWVGSLVSWRT